MNKPVSRKEMEAFKADPKQRSIGGKSLMFRDNSGKEYYHPNRSERKKSQRDAVKKTDIVNNRKTTRGRRTITLSTTVEKFGKIIKIIKSQFKQRTDHGKPKEE